MNYCIIIFLAAIFHITFILFLDKATKGIRIIHLCMIVTYCVLSFESQRFYSSMAFRSAVRSKLFFQQQSAAKEIKKSIESFRKNHMTTPQTTDDLLGFCDERLLADFHGYAIVNMPDKNAYWLLPCMSNPCKKSLFYLDQEGILTFETVLVEYGHPRRVPSAVWRK